MSLSDLTSDATPPFDRLFFPSGWAITRPGDGEIGGQTHGLLVAMNMIRERFGPDEAGDFTVSVPRCRLRLPVIGGTLLRKCMPRWRYDHPASSMMHCSATANRR